jgi:hypothetical protein
MLIDIALKTLHKDGTTHQLGDKFPVLPALLTGVSQLRVVNGAVECFFQDAWCVMQGGEKFAADVLAAKKAIDDEAAAARAARENTLPAIQKRLTAFVQNYLDAKAQERGYDNIFTAVTYAEEESVPQFQAEGRAFRQWRSQVWARCYQLMVEVQASMRPVPTEEELIAELPKLTLG